MNPFIKNFKGISEDLALKTFWNLIEGKFINPNNWYAKVSYVIGRIAIYKILKHSGRLAEEMYQISYQWFDYLVKRTTPHEPDISNDFFLKIYSNFPVVNQKLMISLYQEGCSMCEEDNLLEILRDPSISIIRKIRKFKENFLNGYNRFQLRCQHFGDEISKFEGNRRVGRWGNRIQEIFMSPAPTPLIIKVLDLIRHIKNAISHSRIIPLDDNRVEITDKDPSGKITFKEIYHIKAIWNLYYLLLILDKGYDIFSLLIDVTREVRRMNDDNTNIFICNCEKISIEFMAPNNQYAIICSNCKKIHFSWDLSINGYLVLGKRGPFRILYNNS